MSAVTMQELELETAELLPARETLMASTIHSTSIYPWNPEGSNYPGHVHPWW
jgi:hypothetical protein